MNKSINVARIYLMESADEAAFHRKRFEARGGATDQGTEADIGSNTARILTNTEYDDGSDMECIRGCYLWRATYT